MIIAYLLQDTGAVYGAERATLDLATGMAEHGVDVRILLIRESRLGLASSPVDAAFRERGLSVIAVETGARFSIGLVRRIRRILSQQDVGVLHTVGYKADVHGLLARRRIPQVSTVHGWLFRSDLKERFYGWLNVCALKRCARVVVLSRYYEELLRQQGVMTIRIPSGLDASGFPDVSSHHGTFTVGMMGRFSEEKNHPMLLSAAKRLIESGVTIDMLLAGDGPLRGSVEAEIARLDLRHVVKVKGYVPREDFLGSIDVLALCSRIENLPYSVMEAMACGLPVIATNVGGLPDLVEDGVTGHLVASDDDVALAARIASVAKLPDVSAAMGQASRAKVKREFALERMIASHMDLYRALCR
ncbi:MAG: glycosyltransferase [bacterium]